MECPFCTASLPDDDIFCEACGKPLAQPVPSAPPAIGCTCGAPADEIDEDGYCGRCGRLARRPASDHVELVISPDFAGVSDRGIKHQRNEDRFDMRQANGGYVMVVCDGVSSSTQSELASSLVAENVAKSLEASLRRHSASSPERTVRTAIYEAQSRLAAEVNEPGDPPSTTVVAALINQLDVTVGWAGDSRAYWFGADGDLRQLTSDHSWMNEVVAAGTMKAEEAAKAPQAHGITRWLGSDAGDNADPDVMHFKIPGAGCLLLCTDGLWNYTDDTVQLHALLQGDGAIDITRHLIDFANEKGGQDNITALLLRVGQSAEEENQSNGHMPDPPAPIPEPPAVAPPSNEVVGPAAAEADGQAKACPTE
jgi:serine/threonine protein phosphatase PrpC